MSRPGRWLRTKDYSSTRGFRVIPLSEMIWRDDLGGDGSRRMSISKLTLYKVAVPLKRVIRHASFARSESENLIVKVTLADGTSGYGEGVPRSYVTGETIESTFADLRVR